MNFIIAASAKESLDRGRRDGYNRKRNAGAPARKEKEKPMVRLDKYVSDALPCTRREAASLIRARRVAVDGKTALSADEKLDETRAAVLLDGKPLLYSKYVYLMLNKPAGLVSATEDAREKTVLSLLPDSYLTKGLFPAGRLDKDTTGLLILTNDGALAHRLLSPKYNKTKVYRVTVREPFTEADAEALKKGVRLDDGMTKPAILEISTEDPRVACLTLTEGRFHEVKRMCLALGNECLSLERVEFARLSLDPTLARGAWRRLTPEEIAVLSGIEATNEEEEA